jgi:hypothetical protein
MHFDARWDTRRHGHARVSLDGPVFVLLGPTLRFFTSRLDPLPAHTTPSAPETLAGTSPFEALLCPARCRQQHGRGGHRLVCMEWGFDGKLPLQAHPTFPDAPIAPTAHRRLGYTEPWAMADE